MYKLEVKELYKSFGGVQATDNISITVAPKQIVSIIGPNGAGKTTLFNLISGIYQPDKGEILLDNEKISGLELHEIAHKGVARTFQNIRLFKGLTVLENVMTARDPNAKYSIFDSFFLTPRKTKIDNANKQDCLQYLEIVGLLDYKDENPENLAYGLQRKLEIARAMAINPKILLLDEPAAGLNPSEIEEFIELVKKLHRENDISIILIEHRMKVVMDLSDWIYVLNFGKMLASGTGEEIQNNAEVTKAYIGEDD